MSITIFSQEEQKHNQDTSSNKSSTENSEKELISPVNELKEIISPDEKPQHASETKIKADIKKVDSLSHTIKKEHHTRKNLVSFAPKPIKAYFDAQMKEETIVLMLRQHPITQLGKVLISIIGIFFPILLFSSPFLDFLQPSYKAAIIIGWYLVLSGFTFEIFLSWYFHVFFITDRRVIDVDFNSMINKDITSAKLENIQDVSYTTSGVLASIVNFGTVFLQTASSQAKVEFEKVPQPSKVAKVINELIIQKKRKLRKEKF